MYTSHISGISTGHLGVAQRLWGCCDDRLVVARNLSARQVFSFLQYISTWVTTVPKDSVPDYAGFISLGANNSVNCLFLYLLLLVLLAFSFQGFFLRPRVLVTTFRGLWCLRRFTLDLCLLPL